MEYLKYFDALLVNRLITPIWKEILFILNDELDESDDKDDFLILLQCYFPLMTTEIFVCL